MRILIVRHLFRLNPDFPQSAIDDVVHVVANPDHPSLEQNNRALHRLYTNGVKVEYTSTKDGDDGKLLEKLLKDEIRGRMSRNVVQEKAYTDRLIETLRKYHNRSIETAQVIEEMIEMAKDFQERLKQNAQLGLSSDELAFYDALAANESAVRELSDNILKKIAVELTEKLRNSTTVDWQHRESVRAKLRNLIRRLLRKYKYPPDEAPEAIKLVMQQAEALASSWSGDKL